VRVVHDHNVSVFCIQAHYLIGANPLAGLGELGRGDGSLLQRLHHIQSPAGPSEVDSAVELEALSALEVMGAEGPVSRLLLGHAVRSRIVYAATPFCYPGGDIIAAPLPQPGAAGVDALAAELSFQGTDLLLAHHIGNLRLMAGLGPDPADLIDVDIDLGDGSHRNYNLPRPCRQSSAYGAGLSRPSGGIDHDNSMIAAANCVIDRVQHPILMEPQGGVGEVVQIHDILNEFRGLINPRQRMGYSHNSKIKIVVMNKNMIVADEGGDDMKRSMAILMIMAIASLWLPSLGQSDYKSPLGQDRPSYPSAGSAIKKMEDKMAEDLAALPSPAKSSMGDPDRNSTALEPESFNRENSSINSSLPQNGSLNNISQNSSQCTSPLSGQQNRTDAVSTDSGSGSASGSNSPNHFKGTYATRASRHEIGKGGVDSSIFLKGEFEMDKSIKFQDRGF